MTPLPHIHCYNRWMDSLQDILSDKNFDAPDEIAAIKEFVHKKYNMDVTVQVRDQNIIVVVSSAPLATRLRYDMPALKTAANTTKRITFRIIG